MAENKQKWVRKNSGKTEFVDVSVAEALAEVVSESPISEVVVAEVSELEAPTAPSSKPKKDPTPPKPGMSRCQWCGKWINPDKHDSEEGDYCKDLHQQFTNQDLAEHRLSMSANDVPVDENGTPYVKLAALGKMCEKRGIPISRLVKAFGGDRCLNPEKVHPKFRPVYVGNARWMHPWCATEEGFAYIISMGGALRGKQNEGTTKRAKKELADALTPPSEDEA